MCLRGACCVCVVCGRLVVLHQVGSASISPGVVVAALVFLLGGVQRCNIALFSILSDMRLIVIKC